MEKYSGKYPAKEAKHSSHATAGCTVEPPLGAGAAPWLVAAAAAGAPPPRWPMDACACKSAALLEPAEPARAGDAPWSRDREDTSSSLLQARRCEKDTAVPPLPLLPVARGRTVRLVVAAAAAAVEEEEGTGLRKRNPRG